LNNFVSLNKNLYKTPWYIIMNKTISSNMAKIRSVFEAHKIEKAYLFGSVITDKFNKDSDIDFLVKFKEGLKPLEKGELWWDLHDTLRDLFKREIDYDEIHLAIKYLAEQKSYFSANIFIKLTKNIKYQVSKKRTKAGYNDITKREQDVLELICKGLSNFEISEKLFISERTVEKHKANLYAKTNTENALKLALFAFQNDLVEM